MLKFIGLLSILTMDLEGIWIASMFSRRRISALYIYIYIYIYIFFNQRLLYCSWDMNSANRQMNSILVLIVIRKLFFLLFSVFNFQFSVK